MPAQSSISGFVRPVSRTPSFVVFDLDGTLVDGYAAITEALAFAMTTMGLEPLPLSQVRKMVGHGLERLLEQSVGAERASEGVTLFREKYGEVAIDKTDLMPGAEETLSLLAERGIAMAVASNKPARFSRAILESQGVGRFLSEIAGPDPETPAKPDPTMLRRLMARAGFGPQETLVVGDMEVDSEFARAAGCRVVLLPTGSRSREELRRVDADALLDRLTDLPGWLDLRSR